MKYGKQVLALLVLCVVGAAVAHAAGRLSLEGLMGGKIKIHMDITIDNTSVTGTYYYFKYRKPITLSGTYNLQNGNLKMSEMDQGKVVGSFDGFLDANGNYTGTWRNPSGSKSMGFQLYPVGP